MALKIAIKHGNRTQLAFLSEQVTVTEIYDVARGLFDLSADVKFTLEVEDKDFTSWVELHPKYVVQHLDIFKLKVRSIYPCHL